MSPSTFLRKRALGRSCGVAFADWVTPYGALFPWLVPPSDQLHFLYEDADTRRTFLLILAEAIK